MSLRQAFRFPAWGGMTEVFPWSPLHVIPATPSPPVSLCSDSAIQAAFDAFLQIQQIHGVKSTLDMQAAKTH
jgi:hypothetical protein